MPTNYPINPRVQAIGKARLDIARRAKSQLEWEKLWKQPLNAFPFDWGDAWKQCIEYRVDNFPAEVGFFTDILGLPINALNSGYAMFTSPTRDFYFSVIPTHQNDQATPPDAFRLQFMVKDLATTTHQLQQRGIEFDQALQPLHPGSALHISTFRTPHGICVELWSDVTAFQTNQAEMKASINFGTGEKPDEQDDEDDQDEFEEDDFNDDDEGEENFTEIDEDDEERDEKFENDDHEFPEEGEEDELEEEEEQEEEDIDDDFDIDEDEFDEDEEEQEDLDWDDDDSYDDEDLASPGATSYKTSLPKTSPALTEVETGNQVKGMQIINAQNPGIIDLDIT
jgi:hypothetical protein